jgi:hypothetical protein
MMLRLALRSVTARPARSLVLASGFGLGIAVMACLLGVGEVALEQATSPKLDGGGDALVRSWTGEVPATRFVMARVLGQPPLATLVSASSPSRMATVHAVGRDGASITVRARGGVPSLERAIGDPETMQVAAWRDAPGDAAWREPRLADLVRAMDRFHPPATSARWAPSYAEWLYFNGTAADGATKFFLSFIAGAPTTGGLRGAGVRLQLTRDGVTRVFEQHGEVDAAKVLRDAPDLEFPGGSVRLEGLRYSVALELPATDGGTGVTATFALSADRGPSLPPLELHGLNGWESGYVVPVSTGALQGELVVGDAKVSLAGGHGYHDHNWGSWEGVTWRWGQVAGEGLSLVWGHVVPPREAADPDLVPPVLVVQGAEGLVGVTQDVDVVEENDASGQPRRIAVRARGSALALEIVLEPVEVVATTRSGGAGADFVQLRATATVTGRVGSRQVSFVAAASAETFRGSPPTSQGQ